MPLIPRIVLLVSRIMPLIFKKAGHHLCPPDHHWPPLMLRGGGDSVNEKSKRFKCLSSFIENTEFPFHVF